MGGVHEKCGYRCAGPNSPWTVATCVQVDPDSGFYGPGEWRFDDGCEGQPGG
jgi:hypothetical protein